jgi:hypothetical protein
MWMKAKIGHTAPFTWLFLYLAFTFRAMGPVQYRLSTLFFHKWKNKVDDAA